MSAPDRQRLSGWGLSMSTVLVRPCGAVNSSRKDYGNCVVAENPPRKRHACSPAWNADRASELIDDILRSVTKIRADGAEIFGGLPDHSVWSAAEWSVTAADSSRWMPMGPGAP